MNNAQDWFQQRTYRHEQFPLKQLLVAKARQQVNISVCLPTCQVADTLAATLAQIVNLQHEGLIDQVAVVDANSSDKSAEIAASHGVEVFQEEDLCPQFGPCLGKGDAIWRVLTVVNGDLVVFVDSDSSNFGPHYITGLVGPLLFDQEVSYVKGSFARPFAAAGIQQSQGGGRVNELCARPLLNLFYPQLAGFHQPLAGEIAARRELLLRLPFYTGYALEITQLIEAYRAAGLGALAQVYLGSRQNAHQPLRSLSAMAYAVLQGVCKQLSKEGRITRLDAGQFLYPLIDREQQLAELRVEVIERPSHGLQVGAT